MNEQNGNKKEKRTKRRSRTVIWVGLALLVVVAVTMGGYFYIQSSETRNLEEARTAISMSDWEMADSSLEQALNTQPAFIRQHDNEAIALRGFVNYQMGDLPTALADMDQALADDSDLVDLLSYRANIHFRQNDHELALKDGKVAIEQSELLSAHLLAILHANQAIISYQLNDDQAVVAEVDAAIIHSQYLEDEVLAELYAMRANSAYGQGDFETALEDTRSALSFDVVLSDELLAALYANQAEILFERQQYDRAMDASDQALEYASFLPAKTMTNLYLERSQFLYEQGDLAAAIGEAEQAASYGEDLPLPHALQALESFQLFDAKEAMDEAEAALALDDQNVLANRIRGTLLVQQGDNHTALEHLEQAQSLEPNDLDTLAMCVQVHLNLGDLKAAEADLARAVDLAPNTVETLWAKAMVHLYDYEFEEARTLLDKAIALDSDRLELYVLRSQTYHQAHELEDAEADLERALAINPEFLAAQAGVVLNNASRFDYDNFETQIQGLVDENPKWAQGHVILADYHTWTTGDLDKAMVHVDKVIELSPESVKGHVLQGSVLLEQNEHEQALASFERALAIHNDSTYARGGLVEYYLAINDLDMALATIDEIITFTPESSHPRVWKAKIYLSKGDLDNAWITVNQLLDNDPENPYALLTRADINFQVGNSQQAMIDLSRTLDIYPLFAEALLERAAIYYFQGDLDSAKQYAIQTLEVDRTMGLAHGLLSDIAFAENDLEESLTQTDLMIEEMPDFSFGYFDQGLVNSSLGRFDEALVSYSTGLEVETEDNDMIGLLTYHRALINFTLGDKEQALADFQSVLETTSNVELLNDTENLLAYPSSIPVIADGRFLVEDEIQRFAISYSQDWDRMEDDPENGYVLSLWIEEEDVIASVDIYLLEFPLGVSELAGAIAEAFYAPGSFNSLSLNDVEIAGGNGLVRQYELIYDDMVVDGRQYYAVRDGRAVIIITETSPGDYDIFAKEFEAIVASFAFLP